MPSDPLPLSPETPATDAGNWLLGVPVPMFATRPALRQWSNDTLLPAVLAIEQEARTLARAEVERLIAEVVRVAEWNLGREGCPFCGIWDVHATDCVARAFGARSYEGDVHPEDQPAALPRLGERE